MSSVSRLQAESNQVSDVGKQPYIEVKSATLAELFSGAHVFHMPWFQRAYAWQTDHVARLIGDLFTVLAAEGAASQYFLGTVLVSKSDASSDTSLVDGHQRVMTLTILFAVLRDLIENDIEKAALDRFIKTSDLHLQPQDAQSEFCGSYVQNNGATEVVPENGFEELSYTERNIIANRDYLRERLTSDEVTPELRKQLVDLLSQRCHVIIHTAPNDAEAWSRLRKEEETRLDFSHADLAKESLLSMVPAGDRPKCSRLWEQAEQLVGADDMYPLLKHIWTLKRRKTTVGPLEEDLAQAFALNRNGLSFMEEVLLPAAWRLNALRTGTIGTGSARASIAASCKQLTWIDNQIWVPAALLWLQKRGESGARTAKFFKRLERLIWIMKIARVDPERWQPKLIELLRQIETGADVDELRALNIDRNLLLKALLTLRGPRFDRKPFKTEVLRRIAIVDSWKPGPIESSTVTVEHILPRGWAVKNEWRKDFPDRAHVEQYAHGLGNLTLLSKEHNNEAGSRSFAEKKKIYARSDFKLTKKLKQNRTWTAEDISNRTEDMIATLFKSWELTVEAT